MIKCISILALILGAIAAAQIGVGGPSDITSDRAVNTMADRFRAADVPTLDFGTNSPRWSLPKS